MQTQPNMIDNIIIPHTTFLDALNKMQQMYTFSEGRNQPTGITLTGESGSGKTTLLKHLARCYPRKLTAEGLTVPVLMITVPSVPTSRELSATMLDALGAPESPRSESESKLTKRLKVLMRECGVRLLIMEEYQHFVIRGDKRLLAAADWLKVLLDDTNVLAVISGLKETLQVLELNEQLKRRFSSNLELPRFDWKREADKLELMGILKAFKKGLNDFDMPDIDSEEIAFRFYIGSGGLICYIKKIIQQAIWNCLEDNRTALSMDDLARSWKESLHQPFHGTFNPFDRNIDIWDKSRLHETLSFAEAVGTVSKRDGSKATKGRPS